jgi:UDP-glucose 4-epimerase
LKKLNKILVTGGAGYIGSHTCVELLQAGYEVVIYDNLCNSHAEVINRIEAITNKRPSLVIGDIRDQTSLVQCMNEHQFDAVMHFAGLKAVGESVEQPLKYFDNNFTGSLKLLEAMKASNIKTIVFSSSATVYGDPVYLPFDEKHPLAPTNPYGQTKLFIEEMLKDLHVAEPDWHIGILRYFNPVGAHESGFIGEDPQGIPNNLMPYIAQVAVGKRESLNIWGNDYPTTDGTGVRDYIHVTDLALGHIKTLEHLVQQPKLFVANLGSGKGSSVLQVLTAFEAAAQKSIPYVFKERRAGDVAEFYADPALANQLLNWKTTKTLDIMCQDHWHWQQKNPSGYQP